MQRYHYLDLDGLRGIAALTVVLFHCDGLFSQYRIFCHGYLSVDVFFELSGFVIALNYEQRLRQGMSLSDFLRKRGHRLLPIYWIGLCVSAIGCSFLGKYFIDFPLTLIAGILLLPSFILGEKAYPLNGPSWSLFSEWVANGIYAGAFYRLKAETLAIIVLAGWIGMTIIGCYSDSGWSIGEYIPDLYICIFLRAVPSFLAGVLVYRLKDHHWMQRLPVIMPEILFSIWLLIAEVPTFGPTPIYDAFVAILCGPLLIALLIRSEARAPKWCAWVGRLSYPLYASHIAIIMVAQSIIKRPNPLYGLLTVAAALLLAWVIAGANDRIQDWIRRPDPAARPTE